MQTVRMSRKKLLDIITANLAKHVEAHAAAIEGWEVKQEAALEAALANFKKKRAIRSDVFGGGIVLAKPQSHADEYRRVISMLKHSVEEVIELTTEEFDRYVHNQWSWAREFAASTSAYLKKGKR